MSRAVWTLGSARKLCRDLEKRLAPLNWHVGIIGSVLLQGRSEKDLDLVLYPHWPLSTVETAREVIASHPGMEPWVNATKLREWWRRKKSIDNKLVEVWKYHGRRVDVFIWEPKIVSVPISIE